MRVKIKPMIHKLLFRVWILFSPANGKENGRWKEFSFFLPLKLSQPNQDLISVTINNTSK